MIINGTFFDTENKKYIMGILNVTPDSFSDGGKFNSVEAAKKQTWAMIEAGASLIDVGGESTRPGYTVISDDEEINRVTPVIEAIRKEFDIPVSIDTYKSRVATAAIEAGAGLVNDIWGCMHDKDMASVIAKNDVACCLMHNRDNTNYVNFIEDVLKDLQLSIDTVLKAGVSKEKIMVDPGIGFAKNYEQNLIAIKEVNRLSKLGYPVLLATSKKSVIGLTLDVDVDNRVEGTLATTAYAFLNSNVSFFRVHDVRENIRLIKMLEAIKSAEVYHG